MALKKLETTKVLNRIGLFASKFRLFLPKSKF
jgi:hypothetical protein